MTRRIIGIAIALLFAACAQEKDPIRTTTSAEQADWAEQYHAAKQLQPIDSSDPDKWNIYGVSLGQNLDDVRKYLSGEWVEKYSDHYGRYLLRAPNPEIGRHGMIVASGANAEDPNIVNEIYLIGRHPELTMAEPKYVAWMLEMVWGAGVQFGPREDKNPDRSWFDEDDGVQAHLRYEPENNPPRITLALSRFDGTITSREEQAESERWRDKSNTFAAAFPIEPDLVETTPNPTGAYAYQAIQEFDSGLALYSITVVPIEGPLEALNERMFLENSNSTFVRSLGRELEEVVTSWDVLYDGRDRMNYSLNHVQDGEPIISRGYWTINNKAVIRVSVAYTATLDASDARKVLHFPSSFRILK